jgi:hypothetical protein
VVQVLVCFEHLVGPSGQQLRQGLDTRKAVLYRLTRHVVPGVTRWASARLSVGLPFEPRGHC